MNIMNKEFSLEEAEDFIDNIYQHKFDNMEETLEDGTQVVHINGLDDIEFTDFESASFTLLRGEQRLKYQVKKQKEVIDKINNFCKDDKNFEILDLYSQDIVYEIQEKLLSILKEEEND